ncbi:hypothetical protein PMAYCL1PPCAC_11258 [Pristionchus mayeri]|uniref:Uncharacterized protein n=1 Tax=Pristionchus mayeri TaxID=1317129 RepID=A0AAN4ZGZ3_9BILA|nr:hypothetical protein PMAYCL1PPCAC_11253 [Pristionchus mayeri]GMR41059.1 hypothetical protein PMAYCL1PPCAC_11254 [Pristionchus mayeri]GMR41062.1 hypothetical protein PMAYCL1PPCAC_11257 [Pristionchus mayeri]GMR41063.1 hypothetical protein PMAYCL1PPCAC_11258 [Pristionchus mayeri]
MEYDFIKADTTFEEVNSSGEVQSWIGTPHPEATGAEILALRTHTALANNGWASEVTVAIEGHSEDPDDSPPSERKDPSIIHECGEVPVALTSLGTVHEDWYPRVGGLEGEENAIATAFDTFRENCCPLVCGRKWSHPIAQNTTDNKSPSVIFLWR